jgi:hypothetical protein
LSTAAARVEVALPLEAPVKVRVYHNGDDVLVAWKQVVNQL